MSRMKSFLICFAVSAFSAFAQSSDGTTQQPLHIGSVDVTGSVRERVEFWDWFGGKGENTYTFSDTLAQIALSQTSPNFEWKVDFAVPIFLGLPTGAVVPAPQGQLGLGGTYYLNNRNDRNAAMIFPKLAYLRFKTTHSNAQVGRFEFGDGAEGNPSDPTIAALKRDRISSRLIGTFGFTGVQRSFDGGDVGFQVGSWTITTVGAIPTRGVYQTDGWGWVKTPFAYVSATHEIKYSARNSAEFRAFGIYYQDFRNVLKTDNRSASVRAADTDDIRIGTYGGHYIQAIQTNPGTFDLLAWGVLQSGAWGELAQRAGAYALEAGFQPAVKAGRPWLRGGYFYGSGDGSAKDGVHGTFFAILPTPRSYARYPFFNEMNNRDAFGEFILRPSKKVSTRVDAHHLSLASANDLWYTGGGAYQPWTFGYQGRPSNGKTDLANLYDASLDYAFVHAASIGFYFGYAQGGDVIKAIYKNPNSPYGFIEFNYHF